MKVKSIISNVVIYPLWLNLLLIFLILTGRAGRVNGQTGIESPPPPPAEDHFIPPLPALLALRTGVDAAAAPVSSDVVMVRVTIKKIAQVDDLDLSFDQADFWTNVRIKSSSRDTTIGSPAWENKDAVAPDWTALSAAKKGEAVYFSISVYDREWPSGNTEVDVNPGGGRAFTINLVAEPGKTYTYTQKGDESPRGEVELVITMEDLFVQLAKDGQNLIRTFADIANEYAPGSSDGAWLKSPWGNWGTAMRASFSDRTEAAVIQLTFSVAASGLLTPIAIYGNVAIQKQVIEFLFKEYVKYMAKEYLKRKRPDHEYLGTYDFQKKNLLYATYRLYSNLNDLIGLYDTEVKSYENVNKLALALNNEINMLTEAVKNAKEVVYHLDVITSNTKELTEFGGIRYKPSETGMYSDMLFTAMYLSLKNELLLKENLLKWFGPDIQISQLICNPAIPAQGQPATFNLTVTNKGASQAAVSGYAAYEVYIDGKSAGKRSGIAKNPLQHNESWTTSFEYIFSSRGTHTVMVKANPDNAVREVLETNNDKSLKLTVDLPDIRVKDVTISPAAPVVNSTKANITVSMENAGKAQAMGIGYSSYKIMVGGKMVWSQAGDATKPPLDPGKTWSTTYTFVFTSAGSNMVSAVVDPDNKVPETVETNNEKTVAINVATPPDLRVKNLSVSPAGPEANYTRAVITATVENIGGAPAGSAGFTAYEAYDGSTRFVKEKGGAPKPPTPPILVPGASTDIVFNYAFPSAGVHTVKFVTDPDNKEPEMLETNNDKAITVNVLPPPPDLVVEGFTCTPSRDWSFKGKGMVSLSVKIKNTGVGPADAAGYAAYDILADGVPVVKARKTAGLPPLAPGNTWTDNNACTFSDGKSTHHLTLKVDPENKVREISEANNEKATDIRMALETVVAPATPLLPDIKVVSMTISPSAPKQRQTATLTVEVENAGKWLCDENGYSSYDLYINDVRATQYRKGSGLGALQAGKTWSTTIPCAFIKAGPNTVKVVMDPENKVKEMDETNNTFIITLKVIEKPVVPGSIN